MHLHTQNMVQGTNVGRRLYSVPGAPGHSPSTESLCRTVAFWLRDTCPNPGRSAASVMAYAFRGLSTETEFIPAPHWIIVANLKLPAFFSCPQKPQNGFKIELNLKIYRSFFYPRSSFSCFCREIQKKKTWKDRKLT